MGKTYILTEAEAKLDMRSPEFKALHAKHWRLGIRNANDPTQIFVFERYVGPDGEPWVRFDTEAVPTEGRS